MNFFPKALSFLSILALLALMTGAVAVAQKGTSIVTRIRFARGRTTAVERGSVHRGMSHDYLLASPYFLKSTGTSGLFFLGPGGGGGTGGNRQITLRVRLSF